MNGADGRPNNHHEDFMTYEMCRRLHEEFGARIDVALAAGTKRMEGLENKFSCLDRKIGSLKNWLIMALVALVADMLDVGKLLKMLFKTVNP